jgi:hypothetical protein
MEQILSTDVLERLERLMHTVNAPAFQRAQPGMTVDEIRGLTSSFPGTLPAEAELWWSWRTWGEGGDILPGVWYAPLDAALEHYDVQRRWAREHGVSPSLPDVTADDWWHPLWLPIFLVDGGMHLVVDVSASDGASAPIRRIDGQSFGGEHFDPIVAPSLGSYVTDMLDAIDAGAYVYDAVNDVWIPAAAV